MFVQGQLPLTITGKLDVARSPSPNYPRILPNVESGIPTTEIEKSLCEMWSALLNTEVGIHDDFFRSEGDSLLSLQVASNMAQHANLSVTVKQIFEHRKISKLLQHYEKSKISSSGEVQAESGVLTGPLDLLPIQQWFFNKSLARPDR